jgi:hypothetical protein
MLTILSSHPLTEERLETMTKAEREANAAVKVILPFPPELISAGEWAALKAICR